MSCWENVKAGYDSDDETINFGARHIAETDNGSFECTTIATFGSGVKDQDNASLPSMNALASPDVLCVSVEETVSLFDFSERSLLSSHKFDAVIKGLALTRDSKFLFLCDQKHCFYILYVPTPQIVFKRSLTSDSGKESKEICQLLLHQESSTKAEAIIVCYDSVYSVNNIDIASLENNLNSQEIDIEEVKVFEYRIPPRTKITCGLVIHNHTNDYTRVFLAGDSYTICRMSSISKLLFFLPIAEPSRHVIKLQISWRLRSIFVLQADGKMLRMCPYTLMRIGFIDLDFPVKDFILMEDISGTTKQLLTLSHAEDTHKTEIKLFNCKGFENIYSIQINDVAFLVPVISLVDDPLYLDKLYQEGVLQKIRLGAITRSQPEFRLQRLLRQRKYEEAKTFAKQNNLDLQLVYKEEVKDYINCITLWSFDPEAGDTLRKKCDIVYLITLLDQITDVEFVVTCCQQAIPSTMMQIRELHSYGRKRIFDEQLEETHANLQSFLCRHIQLMDTFEITAEDLSPEKWISFSKDDLLEVCCEYLQGNELARATTVWLRHEHELVNRVPSDDIIPMLDLIPANLELNVLFSFLSSFLPSVLACKPYILSDIITWLHRKIQLLEWKCSKEWPKVALDFCEWALSIIQPPECEGASTWLVHLHQQHSVPDSPLRKFLQSKNNLADLQFLRTNFEMNLSMEEYVQSDRMELCHLLLKHTPVVKLETMLTGILQQIVLESKLDIEEVISSYIEESVEDVSWWSDEPFPNENEIIALIENLKNIERRLSCVTTVLKCAPVPWSPNIVKLYNKYESCNHHRSADVKIEKEMVEVKLILKKYKLCGHTVITKRGMKFDRIVRVIFAQRKPEMLSDALIVAHSDPKLIAKMHSIVIGDLLKLEKHGAALKHLESVPIKLRIHVCYLILNKIKAMVTNNEEDSDVLHCYLSYLDAMLPCLRSTLELTDDETSNDTLEEFDNTKILIKNKILLRDQFSIGFEKSFSSHEENGKVFLEYVNESFGLTPRELVFNAQRVANLLQLSKVEALLDLADASYAENHYPVTTEALRILASNQEPVTNPQVYKLVNFSKTLLVCFQKVAIGDPNILPTLQIIVGNFTLHCQLDQILDLLDLNSNLREVCQLIHQKQNSHSIQDTPVREVTSSRSSYKHWNISPLYEDSPLNAGSSCTAMEMFLASFWQPSINEHKEQALRKAFKAENGDEVVKLIEEIDVKLEESEENIEQMLEPIVNKLNTENSNILSFKLICKTYRRNNLPILRQQGSVLWKCSQQLLQRLMTAKKADVPLIIGLLHTIPFKDMVVWINNAIKRGRFECSQLSRMAQLGIDCSILMKNKLYLHKLNKLFVIGKWGKRLQKMGMCNKEMMKEGHQNAWDILTKMVQFCPTIELDIVREFCVDFDIPFDTAVLMCLQHLILSWKPDITIVKNRDGIEEIAEMDYGSTLFKAKTYIQEISDTHKLDLKRSLNIIWDKLNTYHYEMYSCVLQLKLMLDPECDMTQSKILLFLMPYKRHVLPTMQETEKWLRFHPDDTDIPLISKWRLPYPLFMEESKSMIEMEVNLQNYRIWLEAPEALNCNPDHICVAAVKNSINKNICVIPMEEWCVYAQHEKLMGDIDECVNHMNDMSVASALLDYVSKRIAPGVDRLSVVEMSLQKIQLWNSESQTGESMDMLKKVNKRLLYYSTCHVLHEHGLGTTEYMALAEDPSALVEALYQHPSILERSLGVSHHHPDIHHVVDMLGPLHNLNLQKIRHNLLERWLLSDMMSGGSLDDSFVDTTQQWQQLDKNICQAFEGAESDLLRARYLLETGNVQDNVDYLVGLCFSPRSTCRARVKLRALNSLFWIIPAEDLSKHIGKDAASIRELSKTVFFMSELEQLQGQLNVTVQDFEDQNKALIVESLWRDHSQNPRALMLMCQICIYYKIYNPRVWANMLCHMEQLNMVKELQVILPKLNHVAHLLCTPQYLSAWNKTIMSPFEKINIPMTMEQEKECANAMFLLQGCPLLKDMDVETIFKHCFKAGRYDLAAAILPLSSSYHRSLFLQELCNVTAIKDLRTALNKLKIYASLPISQAQEIIENYKKQHACNSNDNTPAKCKPPEDEQEKDEQEEKK